ncbi:hypothetical protein O9993_05215 [Vibrio lentus]|nr:hypothetical protein [Vibrio lentus]
MQKSMDDLEAIVRDAKELARGEIYFRGQNEIMLKSFSYQPGTIGVPEFGEVSLVPLSVRKC